MTKFYTLTVVAFFALAAGAKASAPSQIVAAEKQVWQMLKAKDFDRFEKIVSPEFRGVYSDEMTRKSKEIADMRAADFKSYELGKMDVVFVTPDAALICYRATVVSTKNGKDVSNMINAATLWKRQGNAWSVAFHTEMPTK